ncbi:MAG TPA: hypothetical protein PKK85_09045, partial [Methanobacteriaceae archaeon]|nr:hypothetical protein [Methanobacteriaceae archaeon]
TKDNIYQVCQKLVKAGKLEITKEQRGAGKAQNIYTIPSVQGYMRDMEDEETTPTPIPKVARSYQFNQQWDELKNRLIKDGDCGTALKIMVTMEEEARP